MQAVQGWDAVYFLPNEQGVEYIGSELINGRAAVPA